MVPSPHEATAPRHLQPRDAFHSLVTGAGASLEPLFPEVTVPLQGGSAEALFHQLCALRDEDEALSRALCHGVAAQRALVGYAPSASHEGCWLAPAIHVRRAHDALGAACLDAFHLEAGAGDSSRHHGNLYLASLAADGVALPDPASEAFPRDPRFTDDDLALALPGLALARAHERVPEALGYHAAHVALGPPALVRSLAPGGRYFTDHHPDNEVGRLARALALRALDAWGARSQGAWASVWRGACAALEARRRWYAALSTWRTPAPWEAMRALVRARAPFAKGFHRATRLGGAPLDALLDPSTLDVDALLRRLARSPYVVAGRPDASPLTTRAVAFGGPMFGVFTEEELATLRAWIASLTTEPEQPPEAPPRAPHAVATFALRESVIPRRDQRTRSLPERYHRLLTWSDREATDLARTHVEETLSRTRGSKPPWRDGRIVRWMASKLEAQAEAPREPSLASALTRDDAVWLLTQLAPAALVDGAWLGAVTAPGGPRTPEGGLLWRIYRDELGAGVPRQHHGNVLRASLEAQGVTLPPCDARAFIEWEGFVPEAFSVPALWLAVARLGDAVLPEVLGLNLAIEVAGVGSGYALASKVLRRLGVDGHFFDLHNTIDNGATGHSAWAAQAIEARLERVSPEAREAFEARVWAGHEAYGASSAPFVRALALRLGPRLGLRWLGRALPSWT